LLRKFRCKGIIYFWFDGPEKIYITFGAKFIPVYKKNQANEQVLKNLSGLILDYLPFSIICFLRKTVRYKQKIKTL
jgi:hypothetical protein